MSAPANSNEKNEEIRFEERDVQWSPIVLGSIGLTVACLFFAAAMWAFMTGFFAREASLEPALSPFAASHGRTTPPEPRLQSNPVVELRRLRAREDEELSSYGWVDREKGITRVPIERAMEMLAARGLPSRAGTNNGAEAAQR